MLTAFIDLKGEYRQDGDGLLSVIVWERIIRNDLKMQ